MKENDRTIVAEIIKSISPQYQSLNEIIKEIENDFNVFCIEIISWKSMTEERLKNLEKNIAKDTTNNTQEMDGLKVEYFRHLGACEEDKKSQLEKCNKRFGSLERKQAALFAIYSLLMVILGAVIGFALKD